MARFLVLITALTVAVSSHAQNWSQWGANAQHNSATTLIARRIDRIEQEIVVDPLADTIEALSGGFLLAHYPAPVIDGNDVILLRKGGGLSTFAERDTQTWSVVDMRRVNGQLVDHWLYQTDWKPVPYGSASWEPVFHPIVSGNAVYAPAAGGALVQLDRETGALIRRFNPFSGSMIDPSIFVTGPPVADASGNLFYNAMQFDLAAPWDRDPLNSWLVRIGANGSVSSAPFASLNPDAPPADSQCAAIFDASQLPWPPSRDAIAPTVRCGPQRPGINTSPAVAPDGTIYTISRAHFNQRWGFLVAVNPDLTPKWATSLRNRFQDGCDVTIPPSGTPGGCRAGSIVGVDPSDNQAGSGAVPDTTTASPVVAPDGSIYYGAYTRYNYSQGHLMKFDPTGKYVGAYGWGWDLTPAVYAHGGTHSVILKENHYSLGSYCNDPNFCPRDRSANTPSDPEEFYITQLGPSLAPEWKFKSTNTESCVRRSDGGLDCVADHPEGFEWCVNAVAVDARGVVYANNEDGNLYAIAQGGLLDQRIFLRTAIGAAYTPTSIGPDGRVYTQNDGVLFVINQNPKRRAVRSR